MEIHQQNPFLADEGTCWMTMKEEQTIQLFVLKMMTTNKKGEKVFQWNKNQIIIDFYSWFDAIFHC